MTGDREQGTKPLPPIGIGTGRIREDSACRATVRRALEVGYCHVDTARAYGNEPAIGRVIEHADVPREDLVLATKIHSRNLGYDDVHHAIARSCDALGVQTVDVAYVHWPAHTFDPRETLPALAALVDRGTVRHVGISNATVAVLERACAADCATIDAVQVELHPLCQQDDLLAFARRHDVAVVAHTPLCRGDVVDLPPLSEIARKHDATEAQVALSWLVNERDVAAVPGGTGPHLAENLAAASIDLADEDVQRIEAIDRERRYVDYEFAPWRTDSDDS